MRSCELIDGHSSLASKGSSEEGVAEVDASAKVDASVNSVAVVTGVTREERRSGMIPFGGGGGPSGRGGSTGCPMSWRWRVSSSWLTSKTRKSVNLRGGRVKGQLEAKAGRRRGLQLFSSSSVSSLRLFRN